MQRFLVVFTLFLCFYAPNFAQTVAIGTGTNLGSDLTGSLPVNPYYSFTYSQSIYLAKEIDGVGNITAIRYHFNGSSLANSRLLKIYMGHTSRGNFELNDAWLQPNELTLVFDGTTDSVSGDVWLRIPLTTPFAYNGTDNLVIAVDENNPDYDGEHDKFYYSTVPNSEGFRSLVFLSDDYSPTNNVAPNGDLLPYYPNIEIEGLAVNCKTPRDPSVFDISGVAATASWSAPAIGPAPTAYTWKVVPEGLNVDSTVAISSGITANLSAAITGLSAGVAYDFYVRTTCTARNILRWAAPVQFTAGCPPISNFPFLEDFDNTSQQKLPICWTEKDVLNNGRHWKTYAGFGKESPRSAGINVWAEDETLLILPQITLNGNQRLRYSTRLFKGETDHVGYAVKLSTTGKERSDFTVSLTDTMFVRHDQYRDTTHSLEAYSGNVYIAIEVPKDVTEYYNTLYVDDIAVENIPQCVEPTKLRPLSITADSAVLTWQRNGNDLAKWQIYYGDSATVTTPFGRDALDGRTVIADSNVYVLHGLAQQKGYKWWVRRICAVGDTSRWSNFEYFTTPSACGTPANIICVADSTTAQVHWKTPTKARNWTIYYGTADTTLAPSNQDLNGLTFTATTDTSYRLTNLAYPALYSVWIRANCDTSAGNSEWSRLQHFQTYAQNDFCSSATIVNIDSTYTLALQHAKPVTIGGEGLEQNCGSGGTTYRNDVWYKFTTPTNGKKIVIKTTSTDSDNKWVMGLFDTCDGSAIDCQLGNDTNSQTAISLCPHQYMPNATYYIRLYPYSSSQPFDNELIIYTDTTSCPNIPRNDIFNNAIGFMRIDTVMGTTLLATTDDNALPSCEAASSSLYDVWYKFSSGSGAARMLNTDIILDNISRKYLQMTVYKGNYARLIEVVDGCVFTNATTPNVTITVKGMEENQDYYVRVWSHDERGQGDFSLHLDRIRLADSAFVVQTPSRTCKPINSITIDTTNNARWTPIMGDEDIISEINSNGQDLGVIQVNAYNYSDTLRYANQQPYLGRNISLTTEKPFTRPVKLRFYLTKAEWDKLKLAAPSVNDTTFRVVRMVGDSSCKTDVDPMGFTLARMNNPKLNKVGQDYYIEYTTSALGHFFLTTIPKTTIAYPNVHVCPSETSQKDSLVGASGGTYTALPVGLSISSTTGTVNPTASTAGFYTISYAIPDLYGGGVATTTIKVDTATQIIAQPPTRKVLTIGSSITLSVVGVGENLTYQWRKDSVNIPNATTKTLTLPATSMADTGVYSVILTGSCGSAMSINTTISSDNGVIVSAKVFLQGAFNTSTGLMNDNLRTLNLLPTVEPYSNLSAFTQVKGNKNATATPSVLAASDNTAVVDWVFLELRSPTDPSVIVATQSVLVRRDGLVVDVEGNVGIYFGDVPEGTYYVAVRHRNHFGIRTANALNFVKGVATGFDFTTPTASIYVNPNITTNPPTKTITVAGVDYRTLWTGDINQDGFIKYNGSKNDRSVILLKVGGVLTNTSSGYMSEDVNMNGIAKYNGSLNDRSVLLLNVGGILTNVLKQHL